MVLRALRAPGRPGEGMGMQSDAGAVPGAVGEALRRMGCDPEVGGIRVLSGGLSGSATYRVETVTEPVVLKVTLRSGPAFVWQRACREHAFYRDLASRVPLRTPAVLASHLDPGWGAALLLRTYAPYEPPTGGWTEGALCVVAREAAALHGAFWGRGSELTTLGWLDRATPAPNEAAAANAWTAWEGLAAQERLRRMLTDRVLRNVRRWLDAVAQETGDEAPLPTTLVHGDFHAGNLLQDRESCPVWADWQEVRLGQGAEDLSFFLQRAHPGGLPFAPDGVVAAYVARLTAVSGEAVDPAGIRRTMDRYELRVRLYEWPLYLQDAAVEVIEGLVARVAALAEGLADR